MMILIAMVRLVQLGVVILMSTEKTYSMTTKTQVMTKW